MCNMMLSQLCVKWPLPSASPPSGQDTSSDGQQRQPPSNRRLDSVSILDNDKSQENSILETRSAIGSNMISNNLINMSGNLVSLHGNGQESSMAAMLLSGQAAAPKSLVANMPTALLYWPLMQLASSANEDVALGVAVGSRGGGSVQGGASDVRAALLLLLIGKCSTYQAALDEVGGEEFFRYFYYSFVLVYFTIFIRSRLHSNLLYHCRSSFQCLNLDIATFLVEVESVLAFT